MGLDQSGDRIQRALQLNPNSAPRPHRIFLPFAYLGKMEEAGREERAATDSDPLSLDALSIGLSGAYHRRQYDAGLIKARTAIELYPQVSIFHVLLSNFYAAQGKDHLSVEESFWRKKPEAHPPNALPPLEQQMRRPDQRDCDGSESS